MKKQIFSEQIRRMQKLAGILTEQKVVTENTPEALKLKASLQKNVSGFVGDLSSLIKEPKVASLLKAGLADGDPDDDKLLSRTTPLPVKSLIPTQNEIGFDQSILNILTDDYRSLQSILDGNADVGGPIVTYGGKYVIDGHHRWSQVYAANPKAKMSALDIEGKPGFKHTDVLKAVHTAVAVDLKKVPSSNPKGINIMNGVSYDQVLAKVNEKLAESAKVIWASKGIDSNEKIAQHIFTNLQQIVKKGSAPGAPGRADMPQTDAEGGNSVNRVKSLEKGDINVSDPIAENKFESVKKKETFNQQVRRMQKLAGIITESQVREFRDNGDFDGTGLVVVGRTALDNNAIQDMLDDTNYYGVWNGREGYWFFKEQEENFDALEMDLEKEFAQRGINARFEAQF